jgi:hypothetical protein
MARPVLSGQHRPRPRRTAPARAPLPLPTTHRCRPRQPPTRARLPQQRDQTRLLRPLPARPQQRAARHPAPPRRAPASPSWHRRTDHLEPTGPAGRRPRPARLRTQRPRPTRHPPTDRRRQAQPARRRPAPRRRDRGRPLRSAAATPRASAAAPHLPNRREAATRSGPNAAHRQLLPTRIPGHPENLAGHRGGDPHPLHDRHRTRSRLRHPGTQQLQGQQRQAREPQDRPAAQVQKISRHTSAP